MSRKMIRFGRTFYDYEQLKRPKDEEKIKLLKNSLKEISA